MTQMVCRFRQSALLRDTRGLSTVEYVILLGLIVAASVGLWGTFGENVSTYITDATEAVETKMP